MKFIIHKKINNSYFPVLTNVRKSKKKINIPKGKIKLKYDYFNNFVVNAAFDEKNIKYNKYYNNEQSLSLTFKNHLNDVFKIIKSKIKKKDKIIEIGCGRGFFFKILQKNYKNLRGFDKTFKGDNKKIKKRFLTKKDKINEKLIILRHTLEHIHKPYDYLDFLRKISNNNPYILIETPDLDWKIRNQAFFDINYEQPNYFSSKTFQNLFSKKLLINKKVFKKQYLLIMAKLNDLNRNYKSTEKFKNVNLIQLFPKLEKKIKCFNNINQNIFIWGAATKSLMFLIYLKLLNLKAFKNVRFAIDIDKTKQNKFLPIVNIKIIDPKMLKKVMKPGDYIIVSNSNYLSEVKKYIKNIKLIKINYRCLD